MIINLGKWFNNLREADDQTRKRWLFIMTFGASLLVVGVWLVYLNWTLTSISLSINDQQKTNNNQPSLFQIMSKGAILISEKSVNGLANSYSFFNKKSRTKNQLFINSIEQNFIIDSLEKIPAKKLP